MFNKKLLWMSPREVAVMGQSIGAFYGDFWTGWQILGKNISVSKRWRFLIKDPRLWRLVTDSPDESGDLLKFIRAYMGKSLWCFRPNTMTTAGLRLLEARCPNLKYLLVEYGDKTLHHFAHLDIDYLPRIDNIIIKLTKTKNPMMMGERKKLVFYLVAVRDPTNVTIPVKGFDEVSLIKWERSEDQDERINLQLGHHIQ